MGFSFRERMHGKYHRLSEPLVDHDIALELEAHVRDVRGLVATVTGRIRAEGLAHDEVVQGTLALNALHEQRIPYDLRFGDHLRLVGEKDLSWLAPLTTFSTLPFSIIKGPTTWTELARGTLVFDVRGDWRALVRSLRVSPF